MKERLQKLISSAGLASRRQAETLLCAGRVSVNGETAALGQSAAPDSDEITVDGVPLHFSGQRLYLMLHKPRGYVTTLSDEKGRPTVAQLVSDVGTRV
jgi:23S rRNA pseudouridine2605 synthase